MLCARTVCWLHSSSSSSSSLVAAAAAAAAWQRIQLSIGTTAAVHHMALQVVAVFPFLETDFRVLRQRTLRATAACYNVMGWAAWLLSCIPRPVMCAVVRCTSSECAMLSTPFACQANTAVTTAHDTCARTHTRTR